MPSASSARGTGVCSQHLECSAFSQDFDHHGEVRNRHGSLLP